MTNEEMQKKTQQKVQAITTLCKQLEITLAAKQSITEQGFIENTVFYMDTEKYEVDKPEETKEEKKDEKTTDIRE